MVHPSGRSDAWRRIRESEGQSHKKRRLGAVLGETREALESERQEAGTMNKEQVPQARCDQASD